MYDQINNNKRLCVSFLLILSIPVIFWSISRYPDLLAELYRSGDNTLLVRDVGSISKDEAMKTDRESESSLFLVLKTTFNWVDTNKIGMGFAIIFGGAILAFMGQLTFLKRYLSYGGFKGSFVGLLFGSPLGVCTNCATPVGLALRKEGASLETALSTMFASPMLNPIGLVIIFAVFPLELSLVRLIASLVLIALFIPLVARLLKPEEQSDETTQSVCSIPLKPFVPGFDSSGSWFSAVHDSFVLLGRKTWLLARITVPLMLAAGLLSAVVLTYVPLESLAISSANGFLVVVFAAILGVLLPTPMFVDIILVMGLLELGLEKGPAAVLLITLAPISLFSAAVIWRQMSPRLSVVLLSVTCVVGIIGGTAVAGYATMKNHLYKIGLIEKALFIDKAVDSGVSGIAGNWPQATASAQPAAQMFGSGAAWADFNNDGWLDLFVPSVDGNRLYKNNHDETFSDVTIAANIESGGYSVSAVWGDYNNDGFTDLYVVNYGSPVPGAVGSADSLYLNNGDETFTDVSAEAGIYHMAHGMGAAWGDYDSDGLLDIYVANWGRWIFEGDKEQKLELPQVNRSELNFFYHNNGDGTFTEIAKDLGIAGVDRVSQFAEVRETLEKGMPYYSGHSFQPVWIDFDNDNNLDLFVSTDYSVSYLYHNNGDGTFTDVTQECGIGEGTFGMGVAAEDYNGDGFLDLYESNVLPNRLWRNNRDGTFTNVATQTGVTSRNGFGWGVGFFDYDNDKDLDLFVANGFFFSNKSEQQTRKAIFGIGAMNLNRFYEQDSDAKFMDATKDLGLWAGGFSRGLALADYNNDGFVDMYVVNKYSANKLYVNSGNGNNWITLQLEGVKSNRGGVGARVKLITKDGSAQTKMLFAGSSFLSAHSPWLNFGLGESGEQVKVVVYWPSGQRQEIDNLTVNRKHIIREG